MESIERIAQIAQEEIDKENATNPTIQTILKMVEKFLKIRKVMCYGGTAINNLLPKEDRFYDPVRDIPDYDFFSQTPQLHAMELADKIVDAGYTNVEVKPGAHLGTFKVFANYTGVADITELPDQIFERLWDDAIEKEGIHYVPPNFLRMSVYLELSRPKGDVSRWKKVYSRLELLNKHYPITCPRKDKDLTNIYISEKVRTQIEGLLTKEKVVLLGFNAYELQKKTNKWLLPLDVLAEKEDVERVTLAFKSFLEKRGSIVLKGYEPYAELLPMHIDICDTETDTTLIRIYQADACHSYHEGNDGMRIASIPTLLNFFLAIPYAHEHYLDYFTEDRFICTAEQLVRMANDDLPRRYKLLTPITCLGKQKSLVDMRAEKSELYEKLSKNKNSTEYLKYFFTYAPTSTNQTKKQNLKKSLKRLH